MADPNGKSPRPDEPVATPTGKSESAETASVEARRKVLKAGLTGIPVILTLRSAPAWQDPEAAPAAAPTATPGMSGAGTASSNLDPEPTDIQGVDG